MIKSYSLILLILICGFEAQSQSLAQTRCNNIGTGCNLSNWLDAYWDPNWPVAAVYSKEFMTEIKSAGMKTVRLPVCFDLIADSLPPYSLKDTSAVFSRIDSVIKWCNELDIRLIIDNHNIWAIDNDNWRNYEPRLANMWSFLAQRYSYLNAEKVYFEIMNEPSHISNDSLNLMMTTVLDTIRKYAPNRTVVVSCTSWSNGVGYADYKPLNDTNLIYTIHSYDPFPFTHQGFVWANPYYAPGIPFPHSAYDAAIPLNWGFSMQWLDSFKLPMILGEFGVGMYADDESRCNWVDTIGKMIDEHHLPNLSWDIRGSFPIYKSGVVTRDSIIPCFMHALHLYGDTLTSIEHVENLNANIYPNPASGSFAISIDNAERAVLSVTDVTGSVVQTASFIKRCSFNTHNWAAGLYLITITINNNRIVKKLIIN